MEQIELEKSYTQKQYVVAMSYYAVYLKKYIKLLGKVHKEKTKNLQQGWVNKMPLVVNKLFDAMQTIKTYRSEHPEKKFRTIYKDRSCAELLLNKKLN